ncbi:MAG TPA: amidohydrolase family protein [Longimicrobiales bacterium]|nr:amidohydrolase family protein [Longimicrobiales bacterium]
MTSRTVLTIGLLVVPATAAAQARRVDLALSEATNLAVALSPDQTWLALDALGRIWIMPITGGAARPLTDELGDARQPSWSPDGNTIAFQSYRDGGWHIWTVTADGRTLRQLTSGPFDDREPHWSPDGARIAFSSDRGGTYDIWELELATGALHQRTKHPANEWAPAYSADGSIAFASNRSPGPGIYAISAGAERALAQPTGNVSGVVWTPDHRQVSYVLTSGGSTSVIVGGRALAEGEDVFPFRANWLSANELIYTADGRIKRRTLEPAQTSEIPFSIAVAFERPAYARKRPVLTGRTPQPVKGMVAPAIDPAGERVAFVALGDIWLMRIGSEPRRITDDAFLDTDPAWSPDGRQLVFSSDRAGTVDLWIRDLATNTDRRLTSLPTAELRASWSPDGKTIAFLNNRGELQVVDAASGVVRPVHRGQTAPTLFRPGRPTWSADSKYIAISVLQRNSTRYREGTSQVMVVSVEDGSSKIIVPMPHHSAGTRESDGPVWSPDGRQLAVVIDGALQLVPVSADAELAGTPRRLIAGPVDQLSWTADSRRILYSAGTELRLVTVETGTTHPIAVPLTWQRPVPVATIVHAGALFDGRVPALRRDVDIVITQGRITSVQPHRVALHMGRVIDAADKTVMPGLIEMHTHLAEDYGSKLGRLWLAYGVTSVREPVGHPYRSIERREAIESGRYPGPRVFATGYTLDGSRIYYSGAQSVASAEHIAAELTRAEQLGHDLVKTYVRLPDSLQKQVIARAHARGLPVSSHELYPAVAFGADGVEHIRGTSRRGYSTKVSASNRSYNDVIELLARSGMALTPTAGIQGTFAMLAARDPTLLADPRFDALFPSWIVERARTTVRNASPEAEPFRGYGQTVRRVVEQGGRVVAGTDAPIIPFAISLHAEIEYYVLAGLTPFQALQTATVHAAEVLGVGNVLGSIEPGKLADLVIIDGNPLEDIRAARKVHTVLRGGVVYTREQLLAGH